MGICMKNYANKWILQRITAAILIPLTFWFVYQCVLLSNYGYDETKAFFVSKINSSLFFVLFTLLFQVPDIYLEESSLKVSQTFSTFIPL